MKTIEFIEESEELDYSPEDAISEQEFRQSVLRNLWEINNNADTIQKSLTFLHLLISLLGSSLAILLSVLINSI